MPTNFFSCMCGLCFLRLAYHDILKFYILWSLAVFSVNISKAVTKTEEKAVSFSELGFGVSPTVTFLSSYHFRAEDPKAAYCGQ